MEKLKVKNFSKFQDNFELPSLLDIQTLSYEEFLQRNMSADKRKDQGLEEVFREVFPLESYDARMQSIITELDVINVSKAFR